MPRLIPGERSPPRGGWAGWYGTDPSWVIPLEGAARRALGDSLRGELGVGVLSYFVVDVRVPGDRAVHDLTIRFYGRPPYPTYGLAPQEYPRVWAGDRHGSHHRMPDDSLCLWFPHDPVARRWVPADGLLALIKMACDHLFTEDWFRQEQGWLLPEAPHGFPAQEAM